MGTIPEHCISGLENQSDLCSREYNLEVDHLVVYVDDGDAKRIFPKELRFAFADCIVQRRELQTVSRLIFFENMYLEIVCSKKAAIAAKRTALLETHSLIGTQSQQTTASPFELSLRYQPQPPTSKRFHPEQEIEWTKSNESICYAVDNLAAVEEPMCFIVPDSLGLSSWLDLSLKIHRTLTTHPLGVRRVTDIAITTRRANKLSSATSMISRSKIVRIKHGTAPLLELTLDGGSVDRVIDARPNLPILFRY